jgi:hypothetical protein
LASLREHLIFTQSRQDAKRLETRHKHSQWSNCAIIAFFLMSDFEKAIADLDLDLFSKIDSQSTQNDKNHSSRSNLR